MQKKEKTPILGNLVEYKRIKVHTMKKDFFNYQIHKQKYLTYFFQNNFVSYFIICYRDR